MPRTFVQIDPAALVCVAVACAHLHISQKQYVRHVRLWGQTKLSHVRHRPAEEDARPLCHSSLACVHLKLASYYRLSPVRYLQLSVADVLPGTRINMREEK